MARVSSSSQNPFSADPAADGVEPYVSAPSLRGMGYTVPAGYRHHYERSWLAPSRSVVLVLLVLAGGMFYLRSDRLLPLIKGTTVTRVQAVESAASVVNPWTGQAHWGAAQRAEAAFPLNFPANLPPTSAGVTTGSVAGVYKCAQADGSVVYQQGDCGATAAGRSAGEWR